MITPKFKKYILAISYGDYTRDMGGTSKAILAQKEMLSSHGYAHIFLCPFVLKQNTRFGCGRWLVLIDGKTSFIGKTNEILEYLSKLDSIGFKLEEIHLHHLMNLNIEQLEVLLDHLIANIKFYLHDYYTVCCSINMMKNNEIYCGKGAVSNEKCSKCNMFQKAAVASCTISDFLDKYYDRMVFIAPSDTCKEIWISAYPQYSGCVHVIYHQKLSGEYKENMELISEQEPLRVAFLGVQKNIKGWDVFKDIAEKSKNANNDMVFYHFGKSSEKHSFIKSIPVDYNADLNAMVNALRKEKIACVILWALWPETYSYTYYECMASNTFVITNTLSGNISFQVLKNGNGIVLETKDELWTLINDSQNLRTMINKFRTRKKFGPETLTENDELLNHISSGSEVKRVDGYMIEAKTTGRILKTAYCLKLILRKLRKNNSK